MRRDRKQETATLDALDPALTWTGKVRGGTAALVSAVGLLFVCPAVVECRVSEEKWREDYYSLVFLEIFQFYCSAFTVRWSTSVVV